MPGIEDGVVDEHRRPVKKKDPVDDALDRWFIWLIIAATSLYSGLWLAIRAIKGTVNLWRWLDPSGHSRR